MHILISQQLRNRQAAESVSQFRVALVSKPVNIRAGIESARMGYACFAWRRGRRFQAGCAKNTMAHPRLAGKMNDRHLLQSQRPRCEYMKAGIERKIVWTTRCPEKYHRGCLIRLGNFSGNPGSRSRDSAVFANTQLFSSCPVINLGWQGKQVGQGDSGPIGLTLHTPTGWY